MKLLNHFLIIIDSIIFKVKIMMGIFQIKLNMILANIPLNEKVNFIFILFH
jgi:hypothetical protein